ncbi:MAG TPA: 23S rRNA (uracil(1939)-C(5))-methyltransferase RlmD [Flavisolibacter sp.]|nr:23S rRNA (uracil(1939)-C(5))-methyltransferase RlmD [Flavisolibacter sp.]
MRNKNRNKVLEKVLVEDYPAEGRSLSRIEGKVIFIEDAVPGDVVDVRLSRSKKDWAEGRAIHFHEYASDRVRPFCEHFTVCGGCQWQMLPYERQLEYKQQQVMETLRRIGKVDLPVFEPIVGAELIKRYRNKMEYTFGNKRFLLPSELSNPEITAQQDVAGFHAQGIFDKVVDIRECHLQEEPTNRLRIAVKTFAIENGYSFYDIKNHSGFIRTMQMRVCRTGEVMANIVFGHEHERWRTALLDFVKKSFPELTTILYTINEKKNDSLYDLKPVVYHGKGFVIEQLEDFKFKIGPKSFFQTNTSQAERLYQVTRDFAGLTGKEIVYDLYCGTGSIGIFLNKYAGKLIGVEVIKEAVDDAKENAALNKIDHASFFAGDVSEVCNDEFFATHGKPDVIVTDPPRAGMDARLVQKIMEMLAPVVVYVSCNPATQARDLNMMSSKYQVERVRSVDMFPHTHHIENVVKLTLKSS